VSDRGPIVLICDDEEKLRRVLGREVARMGYRARLAANGDEALALLLREDVSVALLDLRMPGRDGLEVLREIKAGWPAVEVIMLTGHGSVETAIAAMRAGAYDYQQKPCHLDELEALLGKAIERRALAERARLFVDGSRDAAIEWGDTSEMARVRDDLAKVAPTDAPVLVLGETGTGKELVARELHARSAVAGGPFVALHCGAIPASLISSTLFGHERGAFTGAEQKKLGLLEVADGGTLFLDELGELPPDVQVQLLRFLQSGEVLRVGATESVHVTARIVGATHVDIDAAVARGDFREDLLYRLDTVRLELPPLRRRTSDVPLLVARFLAELEAKGRPRRVFTPEALDLLLRHEWPGNVRELRQVVERLCILSDGEVVSGEAVARRLQPARRPAPSATGGLELMTFEDAERRLVNLALRRYAGDKPAAAEALGISLKTLYNKIKGYGVDVDQVLRGDAP
jgi:DNA-binding NtrC family response regulator